MAYIHYDSKSNGVTYASVYESYREAGKVKTRRIETLGRVVDKDNGIFSCRGKTFKYTIEEGKTAVPDTILTEPIIPETERLILDLAMPGFWKHIQKGSHSVRVFMIFCPMKVTRSCRWFFIVCLQISRQTVMLKSGTKETTPTLPFRKQTLPARILAGF